MTTTDPFTEAARAEAERMFQDGVNRTYNIAMKEGRAGFIAGARWARTHLPAALTEPPARPEGAEELARLIANADVGEWDCGDLADALLATGRVRVISEDGSA